MRQLGQFGLESQRFAQVLGGQERSLRLFVLGSPDFEPWHFTAHLAEEAEQVGRRDLAPTLLRWKIPPGAPQHLSNSTDEISSVARNGTLLVVSPHGDSGDLLNRVDDARKQGSHILAIHQEGSELIGLSHEVLGIDSLRTSQEIEISQHLITSLAPQEGQRPGLIAPKFLSAGRTAR